MVNFVIEKLQRKRKWNLNFNAATVLESFYWRLFCVCVCVAAAAHVQRLIYATCGTAIDWLPTILTPSTLRPARLQKLNCARDLWAQHVQKGRPKSFYRLICGYETSLLFFFACSYSCNTAFSVAACASRSPSGSRNRLNLAQIEM